MQQPVRTIIKKNNKVDEGNNIYTLLVDGNSLLKTAIVDHRMNNDGREYGGVYTFLRILGNLLQKKDFNFCICAWDGYGSGVLRYEIYPEYKANRDKHYELVAGTTDYDKAIAVYCKKVIQYHNSKKKPEMLKRRETEDESFQWQRGIIQEILENLYVRQFIYDKVEGDDIIAYYCKNKKPNEKVVIVSNDRDLTQLIRSDICQYVISLKKFVTPDNSVQLLGMTHENVVVKKILCGDASDNIKGIKGIGDKTLLSLFPEMKENKVDLEAVVSRSRELLEERKANKKKPLKTLENIVNGTTDGVQGKKIYEINRKIIDLSEPMLTDEALKEMNEELYAPLSSDGRDMSNVYSIISENKLHELSNERTFGNLFGMFNRIMTMEKKYSDKKSC